MELHIFLFQKGHKSVQKGGEPCGGKKGMLYYKGRKRERGRFLKAAPYEEEISCELVLHVAAR